MEKLEKLKYANSRLLISDSCEDNRNRNIIFVYCPPKVGSTSLVSSIRLFANEKYNVIHLHNEDILKILYDIDVSIKDIIQYNKDTGKNVYVFDIYREPIEHKISIFFEKIERFHFNSSSEIVKTIPIETIITRFNNIFPYLGDQDYYRNEYGIQDPQSFDFEKKYLIMRNENVTYIKLRLFDSTHYWPSILKEILGTEVKIVRDYETKDKPIKEVYGKFMEFYKIPENLLDLVRKDEKLSYYMNESERETYLNKWGEKMTHEWCHYVLKEYKVYLKVSSENQRLSEIQKDHYMDNGCVCKNCKIKRERERENCIKNKEVSKIIHVKEEKKLVKIVKREVLKKRNVEIRLNLMKGVW